MLAAWQHASMTYPLTTGFHWGALDFQWYIEACKSRPQPAQTASGFHDVNRFITLGVHPGTDNIPIPKYVEAVATRAALAGTSPLQVAARLHQHADAALTALTKMNAGGNQELARTLDDIRAMALLGKYYGCKIRGATEVALFRRSGDAAHQREAVDQLTDAARYWGEYTTLLNQHYENPLWTNRVGTVDWKLLTAEVAKDIEIARTPRD